MNQKQITSTAMKSILVLMILVEGLGFTQASGNDTAAADAPGPYLVKDITPGGGGSLPLNFTNVNSFSSTLLGTLIRLSKRILEKGGAFKLCGINPSIYLVFTLTKLDQILDIYEDEEKAINSFIS